MSNESRDSAIRDAKRYIREIVRNDWAFEPASATSGSRPSSSSSSNTEREVTEWRLREFDSSGSELEPVSSPEIEPVRPDDDPDFGLNLAISDERRRKRRRQMMEEMSWNEGLRTWVEQRDVWTGARTRRQIMAKEKKEQEQAARDKSEAGEGAAAASSQSSLPSNNADGHTTLVEKTEASLTISDKVGPAAVSPDQQQQEGQELDEEQQPTTVNQGLVDGETKGKESTEAITVPESDTLEITSIPTSTPMSSPTHDPNELDDPYVPVVPSIISTNNPIRAAITPVMYPSIYSKVIVQGLTPTVPINLADVTKAMVQGWKADGQWPPKPANTNIVLQDDASIPKSSANGAAGHERKKSGVASAVRKAGEGGAATSPSHG